MITVDTNVFVYTADGRDVGKQRTADIVLGRPETLACRIARQVIGQFQNAAVRKLKTPHVLAAPRADVLLDSLAGVSPRAVELLGLT